MDSEINITLVWNNQVAQVKSSLTSLDRLKELFYTQFNQKKEELHDSIKIMLQSQNEFNFEVSNDQTLKELLSQLHQEEYIFIFEFNNSTANQANQQNSLQIDWSQFKIEHNQENSDTREQTNQELNQQKEEDKIQIQQELINSKDAILTKSVSLLEDIRKQNNISLLRQYFVRFQEYSSLCQEEEQNSCQLNVSQQLQKINQLIQDQVTHQINQLQQTILSNLEEDNQENFDDYVTNSYLYSEPQVHQVKCIDCEQDPIIGVRYYCQKCNADLCSSCEYNLNHQHPLLKIRSPTQTSGNLLQNKVNESKNQQGSNLVNEAWQIQDYEDYNQMQQEEGHSGSMLKSIKNKIKGQKINLQGSITVQKENSSQEIFQKVLPNTIIQEKLFLSNTGNQKWPNNCKIVQTNGNIAFDVQYFIPSLQPGGSSLVVLNIVAPSQEGYYHSVFQLATEESQKFGDKLAFKIYVYGKEIKEKVMKLVSMGYLDTKENLKLLENYEGDFQQVVLCLSEKKNEQ